MGDLITHSRLSTSTTSTAVMSSMAAQQIALITGSNQGLGYEIAKKLLKEHPTYTVIVASRNLSSCESAIKRLSTEIPNLDTSRLSAIQLDVTDVTSIEAAAKVVKQRYGRLDALINNAGIPDLFASSNLPRSLSDKAANFTRLYATNVTGAYLVTEAFAPLLDASANPRVVFMSSYLGSISEYAQNTRSNDFISLPGYRSSKAALNMVMTDYAVQKRGRWRVNAVCPGFRPTRFTDHSPMAQGPAADGAKEPVRLVTDGEGEVRSGTWTEDPGKELGW